METQEHIMAYYPLFEHMQSEHGLTLLESELQEIIRLSDEVKQKYNEASDGSPFASTESKCNKHIVKRSFKFDYKFGHISKEGYRHFPIIYFACGKNGFSLCLLGATITVKLW